MKIMPRNSVDRVTPPSRGNCNGVTGATFFPVDVVWIGSWLKFRLGDGGEGGPTFPTCTWSVSALVVDGRQSNNFKVVYASVLLFPGRRPVVLTRNAYRTSHQRRPRHAPFFFFYRFLSIPPIPYYHSIP